MENASNVLFHAFLTFAFVISANAGEGAVFWPNPTYYPTERMSDGQWNM